MNGLNRGFPGILSFGKSDTGLKRSNNEDTLILRPEIGLFAVADGMGGAAAGEVASQIFAETVSRVFGEKERVSGQETHDLVQEVFRQANEKILNHVKENSQHKGMGCTAELLAFNQDHYVLGHVGDSRTYLFRRGELKQLTLDHSLVQDQVDQGLITAEEARKHSLRNVILRAVGVNEFLAVDLIRGKGVPGDLLLLCSDGLSDMVDDPSIANVLSHPVGVAQKVERLIELAKSAGGHDNITVVLCEVMAS
jgi:serine/threonine protein phosphatase PrpC